MEQLPVRYTTLRACSISRTPQKNSAEQLRQKICKESFQLQNALDQLRYKKGEGIPDQRFEDARYIYMTLKEDADNFFQMVGSAEPQDLLESRTPQVIKNQFNATLDGIEVLDSLLNKINLKTYDNLMWLQTFPKALQSNLVQMQSELKVFKQRQEFFLEIVRQELNPENETSYLTNQQKHALFKYKEALQKRMCECLDTLHETRQCIEGLMNEQRIAYLNEKQVKDQKNYILDSKNNAYQDIDSNPNQEEIKESDISNHRQPKVELTEEEKRNEEEKLREQKLEAWREIEEERQTEEFVKALQYNKVDDVKTIKRTYDMDKNESLRIIRGNKVIYIGNSEENIDVLTKNMELLTTIDINKKKLWHCLEINNDLYVCVTKQNQLFIFSLPDYKLIQLLQPKLIIIHMLWVKDSLILFSCENGILNLFDLNGMITLSQLKVDMKHLWMAIKCEEVKNQLIVAGEGGLFVVEIINSNELKLIDEKFSVDQEVKCILQIGPFSYLFGSTRCDKIEVAGIIDRTTKKIKAIKNPFYDGSIWYIEKVYGLNDVAIIQTQESLYTFNFRTHSLTHLIYNYSIFSVQCIASEFDPKEQCLTVFAIKEAEKQKHILEVKVAQKRPSKCSQQ